MAQTEKITLEELEDTLTEAFKDAKNRVFNPGPRGTSSEALVAVGTIGQALVAVKKEQREAQKKAASKPLDFGPVSKDY